MILLERYLSQVGRFLPKKDREDTLKELKSHILENVDMKIESGLEESKALHDVLVEFGSPRTVAYEYKEEEPIYSKEIEPLVFLIIKVISVTFPLAIFAATTIEYITSQTNPTAMNLFLQLAYQIPSIITSLATTIVIILAIFIIVDKKVKVKFSLEAKEYKPESLPLMPIKVYKISRFEVTFNVFVTVLFLYLLNMEPGLIAITLNNVREPLLNSNFDKLLPLFNISMFISLGYNIAFGIKGARTKVTGSIEFFDAVFGFIVMLMLANGDIFNTVILEEFGITIIPKIFKTLVPVGGGLAIIAAAIKYIKIMIAPSK